VKSLREATREQVENFVQHLGDWAEKNRSALLCQLNVPPPNGERRCRLKRRIQGLVETAPSGADQVPDGVFLVRVDKARIDGMRKSLSNTPIQHPRTGKVYWTRDLESRLLHGQSTLEAGLVLTRLPESEVGQEMSCV
jgi:hypothetical protein